MRKLPTGEPYAGKPPVRFGGRGGVTPFPTPIAGECDGIHVIADFALANPPYDTGLHPFAVA